MAIFRKNSSRTEFTRICIAEAVIALLKDKRLDEIRISAVVTKAGVSRMTFYNNYQSLVDVLKDYLHIVIENYLRECDKHPEIGKMYEMTHIRFSLDFFDNYRNYFVVMKQNGLQGIILDAMNEFMNKNVSDYSERLKINFYAGGLLNTFLEWETKENRSSSSEIATALNNMFF